MDKMMVKDVGFYKAESLIINSVGQRPTLWYAHAIAKPQRGVIGISPFQGLNWLGDLFRRALPYANGDRAFSPFRPFRPFAPSCLRAFALMPFCIRSRRFTVSVAQPRHKAESLIINSVGQRPTKWYAHTIAKPQRGGINLIINHIK